MIARGRSRADYSSIPGFLQVSLRRAAHCMGYRTLRQCVDDLAATGQLVRIDAEIDPHLELAEIQRRVYAAGGPAILFARIKGCRFPMLGNMFGSIERMRFLFRDTLDQVHRLIGMKADPQGRWRIRWRRSERCGKPGRCGRGTSGMARCWPRRRPLPSCRGKFPGPTMAEHSSPGRWSTPKTPIDPGCRIPTWASIACSFPVGNISRGPRSACITRFIVASACIMPRPFVAASRCG